MAKKNLRRQCAKLLKRAQEQGDRVTVQIVLRDLGYRGAEPPTEREIQTLLKGTNNEVVQAAITALGAYQGPSQTHPKQTLETAVRWEEHFESLRGQIDPNLLHRALALTRIEKLGDLKKGRVSPDWNESRLDLYFLLGGKMLSDENVPAKYNSRLGIVCYLSKKEFGRSTERIARVMERETRKRTQQDVCAKFIREAEEKPRQQALRCQIVKIFREAETLGEAEEEMQSQRWSYGGPGCWHTALYRLQQLFREAGL